ncbi:metal ABC transporter permease [Candidatus Similichlamydia epinepheli]|uniref:metal ABC transporter permease n=1 Tax=Candidatus Similichlamydia epinepheli TaxID=1903953 RepID=UPI001300BE94|nr:metal ABC transporter permease [Candidatus Similichlamydia epinepheli]
MLLYFQSGFIDFFYIICRRILSGEIFFELAQDEMQIICLVLVGCFSTYVGSLVYLSRMTMLSNTVSHTSLIGIVMGAFFSNLFRLQDPDQPLSSSAVLLGAFISALVTALLTHIFRRGLRLREDASLALVFSLLFALGVAGVSLFWGKAHVGLDLILGNIELVNLSDTLLLLGTSLLNLMLFFLFKRGLISFVFDREFTSCLFAYSHLFELLLLFQVAIFVMASLRVMGLFLPLAYLVGVPIWSRSISLNLRMMWKSGIILSLLLPILSVACVRGCLTNFGVALSSSGVSIVFLFLAHLFARPFIP